MWLVLSLASMGAYLSDELLGKYYLSNKDEKDGEIKMFIIRNIFIAIVGLFVWLLNLGESGLGPISLAINKPLSLISGIFSLFYDACLYISMAKIPVTIASPFSNTSGIITFIMVLAFFLLTGVDIGVDLSYLSIKTIAVSFLIVSSIIMIIDEIKISKDNKKQKDTFFFGSISAILSAVFDSIDSMALALLFVADYVGEYDLMIVYGFVGIIASIIMYISLCIKNKKVWNIFDFKKEKNAIISSFLIALADVFYILAVGAEPLFASILISTYCAFIPLFSKIFLKEKISFIKYVAVAGIIISVILFSFVDV